MAIDANELAAPTTDAEATSAHDDGAAPGDRTELVEEELLVQEISIDGMCGVY